MRTIARRLMCEEHDPNDASDSEGLAAIRVCNKLGKSLSVLTGVRGYTTLLARALSLAGGEIPWVNELSVSPNGTLAMPPDMEANTSPRETARGGATLVAHLLELFATFIGEALTLRLVQQVWPKAALNPGSKKP